MSIYLNIFLDPTFFLLRKYTDTIDGSIGSNMRSVFKICSALFRICSTSFVLLMINNNTFLHILIFNFLLFRQLFHPTDVYSLWCTCVLIRWVAEVIYAFIDTNITIMWFLFIFVHAWSLFLALVIIRTWSFFMFVHFIFVCARYFDPFQFLPIHRSNYRLNCYFDVFNFFVYAFCSVDVQFHSSGK